MPLSPTPARPEPLAAARARRASCVPALSPALSRAPRFHPSSGGAGAGRLPGGRRHASHAISPGPPDAGGPPRVVPARGGAASGKPRLALAGRPWPLLAKVAQRFFPATEVLFSPTGGLSSPRAVLEAVTTETSPFIGAGKQTQTGARTHATWAPQADGGVPGSVAASPASRSGRFGGCQPWGRACVGLSGRGNVIRGSASPAAAGGRRGGRAARLLPASLVTVAAARLPWPRWRGKSREDFAGECLFSCPGGDGCFKMVCVVSRPCLRGREASRSRACA